MSKKKQEKKSKIGAIPLGDRLIVAAVVDDELSSKGGVYLPESVRSHPDQARVIAVGTGRRNEKGENAAIEDIAVGDIVFVPPVLGTVVEIGGEPYRVINYEDIIAVAD